MFIFYLCLPHVCMYVCTYVSNITHSQQQQQQQQQQHRCLLQGPHLLGMWLGDGDDVDPLDSPYSDMHAEKTMLLQVRHACACACACWLQACNYAHWHVVAGTYVNVCVNIVWMYSHNLCMLLCMSVLHTVEVKIKLPSIFVELS